MLLSEPILTKALGANGAAPAGAASAAARCAEPLHSNPMVSAVRSPRRRLSEIAPSFDLRGVENVLSVAHT